MRKVIRNRVLFIIFLGLSPMSLLAQVRDNLWQPGNTLQQTHRTSTLTTDTTNHYLSSSEQNLQADNKASIWEQTVDLSKKITSNGSLKVGIHLGATAPTRIPDGVSVQSYAPNFAPVIGFSRRFDFWRRFGFQIGLQFEYKGMQTRAKVHDYYTEVNKEQDGVIVRFRGTFTGEIMTQVTTSYATLPVYFYMNITPKYTLKAGGYVSYVLSKSFTGSVEHGYVWTRPTAESKQSDKIFIEHEDFSFSKEMRNWDTGIELAGVHPIINNVYLEIAASMGLISIFDRNFTGISYPMQNIYLTFGLGYNFSSYHR